MVVAATEPMDELVRRVRVLVIEEGKTVTSVATMMGLTRTQVHHMLTGKVYRKAGGPIRAPQTRVKGERRICSRCRGRGDEDWFAVVRDARTGICGKCVRPGDYEDHVVATERRNRYSAARLAIQAEIAKLSAPPWGKSLLSDVDRSELAEKLVEIKRALVVCGGPWGHRGRP